MFKFLFKSIVCLAWLATAEQSFALPAFAKQTAQSCIACHAGGQFPELTPYGRLFKLTAYTIGERAIPISVMAVAGASKMAKPDRVDASLQENNAGQGLSKPINQSISFETGSLFFAGKVTDNIGGFAQMTYDNFAAPNATGANTVGHTGADNIDIRYADQIVTRSTNLIYGLSLNNNPSVSDPWNTASAWMNYVPSTGGKGSNAYIDATTPYPSNGLPGLVSGLSAYAFLNKTFYGELGFYRTANQVLSFMNAGHDASPIKGRHPYWRFAYNKEWGPENLMVGLSGMTSHPYDSAAGIAWSDAASYYTAKSKGLDFQYQYLLDPYALTLQSVYQHQITSPSVQDGGLSMGSNLLRLKASYTYLAKYGGSFSHFNQSGNFATATTGYTGEIFFIPLQNIRVGLQYTQYSRVANIDKPHDANTLRLYGWFAY
jgi:hypothetical protein